jgi:Reverse transcriptase (RNA-dependent DNA polymerase)
MKKKANGQFRARITARGFLQEDGVHYDSDSTAAPVTNETTIKIILTLMTMADWNAQLIDVKGAFLKGQFVEDESLYLRVPEGFEDKYEKGCCLTLTKNYLWFKTSCDCILEGIVNSFSCNGFQKERFGLVFIFQSYR